MYRILVNLRWGNGRRLVKGTLDSLKGVSPKLIAVLLGKDAIAEVQGPPLDVLPEWEEKAKAFQEVGVEDVSDLVDADLTVLSEELDTPVEELEQSVEEALHYVR